MLLDDDTHLVLAGERQRLSSARLSTTDSQQADESCWMGDGER